MSFSSSPAGGITSIEVLEQRLTIEVDLLEEHLWGVSELRMCRKYDLYQGDDLLVLASKGDARASAGAGASSASPASPTRWGSQVQLNVRQCVVQGVTVNGLKASFAVRDMLKKLVHDKNVRELTTAYAQLAGDLLASREGELEVSVPASQADSRELVVRVTFDLLRPKGGVKFAACAQCPDKARCAREGWSFTRGRNARRYHAHMFSYASLCGAETLGCGSGARCWFPCVDTLQSRCRFWLDVTAHESLTVVGSGVLRSSEAVGGARKRWVYEHEDPVAPHNVALAVGPFQRFVGAQLEWVQVYHLPGRSAFAVEKASMHLRRAVKEMVEYMSVDGFATGSFAQVFVDREFAYTAVAPFATVSVVSDALLEAEDQPTPDTPAGAGLLYDRHPLFLQAAGVAYQLFGALVPPKSESDVWVIAGLSSYLAYRYALRSWRPVKIKLPNSGAGGGSSSQQQQQQQQQQTQLPAKTPKPGAPGQDLFVQSTAAQEILVASFERLQFGKERADAVRAQHGTAGNALQRPLQRPLDIKYPVDSCLWAARGFELDCLFSQRAMFMVHMLERMVNLGQDYEGKDDTFAGILAAYVRKGVEEFDLRARLLDAFDAVPAERRRKAKAGRSLVLQASGLSSFGEKRERSGSDGEDNYRTDKDKDKPESDDETANHGSSSSTAEGGASQPGLMHRAPSALSVLSEAEDVGDEQQRQVDSDKSIVGIGEYDLVLKLCRVGGLKAGDFSLFKSGNFADCWLRKCSFLRLRAGVEYRNNNLELVLESARRGALCMTNLPLRLRVVEEDDTWHHERSLTKQRNEHTVPLHTQKQKQRGGRKSQTTKERLSRWANPASLNTRDLLTLFSTDDDDRIWHNEFPVKYCILDPEVMWLRDIEFRQTEVMFLELLTDPNMVDDVLQVSMALKQMATPAAYTDDLVRGGVSSGEGEGAPKSGGEGGGGGGDNTVFDLRMACAIASCVVDYRRPARVRAEALLRLAEWQNYHSPDRARYDKDGGKRVEERPGTHPWVGLNLIIAAAHACMFHPETGKLLPNDFGVPGEQALKRALTHALRVIRAKSSKPPDDVLDMVLRLLRENDNSVNNWSDALYLKDLCATAGDVVAYYVIGTEEEEYRAKGKSATDVEKIGQGLSARDVLGGFYEIVEHVRRLLDYDAVAPSPGHLVTQGCLLALSAMEAAGAIPPQTPFFAYAVFNTPVPPHNHEAAVAARHDWGSAVREHAFRAVIQTYVSNREDQAIYVGEPGERLAAWIGVIKWLLQAIAQDPCPQVQWNVLKLLLCRHADTIERKVPELENHSSPSGCFWPLSNATEDIDARARVPAQELAATLWQLFNEANDADGRLRIGFSQLWRAIWRLDVPPVLKDTLAAPAVEGGPFKGWAESGLERDLDEAPERDSAKPWWASRAEVVQNRHHASAAARSSLHAQQRGAPHSSAAPKRARGEEPLLIPLKRTGKIVVRLAQPRK